MTTVAEAREMVKAYEASVRERKLAEAQEMVSRIDTNIIEKATRGHKFLDFGLNGWDRVVTEMAAEIIVEAGYTIRIEGHFLRIEW